jgi:hypothetical protein
MGENKPLDVELIKKISLLLVAAEPFPDSRIEMSVTQTIDVNYGIELIADALRRDIVSKTESYGAYKALLKRVTYMGVTFEQREPVRLEDDNNV